MTKAGKKLSEEVFFFKIAALRNHIRLDITCGIVNQSHEISDFIYLQMFHLKYQIFLTVPV